ncbi:MAG TPA: hypothetical protein VEC19_02490 [Usitatibacter sp.]|nr:hypothetical protein [Usitatibacter sp.]
MLAAGIVLACCCIALLALHRKAQSEHLYAQPRVARKASPARARVCAPHPAPRVASPDLDLLEWDGPEATTSGAAIALPGAPRLTREESRIRDRYVELRFAGIFHSAADLEDVPRVIEAARVYFEEDQPNTAHELLDIALELAPGSKALRLAQIEIAFLRRDAAGFVELAKALRGAAPGCPEWREVCRLGNALAPDQAIFGAVEARRGHDHYGPWPDMPNWIGASWDLTTEITACEFHRAMADAAAPGEALVLPAAA